MATAVTRVDADQPMSKAAQHLRWFVQAFEQHVQQAASETGIVYQIDRDALVSVFSAWKKAFDQQKPSRQEDYFAFVGFAAGLMLRELIKSKPVSATKIPENADGQKPAHFWPEGYLYVSFCISVRGLVLEKDFHQTQELDQSLDDIRTWWSFRDNVGEDVSFAIAFLDLFAGDKPDWEFPFLFRSNRSRAIASRRATQIIASGD